MDSPIWEWAIERSLDPAHVRRLLADLLTRLVHDFDDCPVGSVTDKAILCQVWSAPGQFPTRVCCYRGPDTVIEWQIVATFARAAQARCVFSDDTPNPYRWLLADPSGEIRPIHVDIDDLDKRQAITLTRWCSARNPHCHEDNGCQQSRIPADAVLTLPPGRPPAT